MAYNTQIPNSTRIQHQSWTDPLFLKARGQSLAANRAFGVNPCDNNTMHSCSQKIGNITPSLCFQADVFYPNALAAVCAAAGDNVDHVQESPSSGPIPRATGCRGNQIGQDFPLESRLPVAIPLVQYPTMTADLFLDQCDLCATPVLNWEKYMETLKVTLSKTPFTKNIPPIERPLTAIDRRRKKRERWRVKCKGLPKECQPMLDDVPTDSSSEDDEQQESSASRMRVEDASGDTNTGPSKLQNVKKKFQHQSKPLTVAEIRQSLFEANPKSESSGGPGKAKSTSERNSENALKLKQFFLRRKKSKQSITTGNPPGLSKPQLITVKNIPKVRLESTWNYAYGGSSGACCIDKKNNEDRTIFVGKGTQVRQIILEKAKSSSILSHRVKSVWDEALSNVPENVARPGMDASDPMSNLVLQVVCPSRRFGLLGVRRGRSIGIYSTDDESPYLLESIPNICYGTRNYSGWKLKGDAVIGDPLLLGLDFNPLYSAELITIDQNAQVRILDINKSTTVNTYSISKPTRRSPNWFEYPKFKHINDAAGVQFGHRGHLFYAWADSTVLLGDQRSAPLIEIFKLRRSTTSLSWSDQVYFNGPSIALNEYISSLKKSSKENYYYVGTTSRVFLMDARVPDQSVLKFEHGTHAAAYLDTYTDSSSFEFIVCGSQRFGATLCAITDQAHVKCFDRPDCTAINPILHCLPKHVSNSHEFFDTITSSGYDLSSDAESQRAKSHNYAWTTGLAITKLDDRPQNPHEPSGVSIFTSNCYGDVFYQEFEHTPVELHRKTDVSDYKFSLFAKGWQSSMKSTSLTEFMKPSLNPFARVDYTLLIEPSARGIQKMTHVRQEPFDPFKPDQLVHGLEIPLHKRLGELRVKYKSDIAQRCLDFWEYDSADDEDESITIKQERLDNEFHLKYGNEWNKDGSRDVEYLFSKQKRVADSLNQAGPSTSKAANMTQEHRRKREESSSSSSSSEHLRLENDDKDANYCSNWYDESETEISDDDQPQLLENDPLRVSPNTNIPTANALADSFQTPHAVGNFGFSQSYFSQPTAVSEPEFSIFESSQLNAPGFGEPEPNLQYFMADNVIPSTSSSSRPNTRSTGRKSKSGF